ncbi:MAG: hypothetical protein IKP78_09080 [Ruminococcus sp.]|nr:hypothetical protein [Ruminococcus sp.]
MRKILFIGGSPCSGKSTVAERLSQEYGAHYFKVDDLLGELIKVSADRGCPVCASISAMSPDEIWLREPQIQCDEEFFIYDELSEAVFERLCGISADFIVTEGAAFTPRIMAKRGITNYIAIVPTPDFQVSRYREREWVKFVLEGCSDKQRAFDNWMKRDILFAEQVKAECEELGFPCIVNDGTRSRDEIFRIVQEFFQLR